MKVVRFTISILQNHLDAKVVLVGEIHPQAPSALIVSTLGRHIAGPIS